MCVGITDVSTAALVLLKCNRVPDWFLWKERKAFIEILGVKLVRREDRQKKRDGFCGKIENI